MYSICSYQHWCGKSQEKSASEASTMDYMSLMKQKRVKADLERNYSYNTVSKEMFGMPCVCRVRLVFWHEL